MKLNKYYLDLYYQDFGQFEKEVLGNPHEADELLKILIQASEDMNAEQKCSIEQDGPEIFQQIEILDMLSYIYMYQGDVDCAVEVLETAVDMTKMTTTQRDDLYFLNRLMRGYLLTHNIDGMHTIKNVIKRLGSSLSGSRINFYDSLADARVYRSMNQLEKALGLYHEAKYVLDPNLLMDDELAQFEEEYQMLIEQKTNSRFK